MAELDPSIILGAKPVQLANPLEYAAQAATLRDLALRGQIQNVTLQQNQRQLQDNQTIAQLYQKNMQSDGSVNHQGIISGLAQAGLGDKIPAYQQQVAAAQEAQGKVNLTGAQTAGALTTNQAAQFELQKKHVDYVDGMIASLKAKPDVSYNDVVGQIQAGVQSGMIDPAAGEQMKSSVPQDPRQLQSFLTQKGLAVLDAKDRLTALTPKLTQLDTGGQTQLVDENALTRGNAPTTFTRTMTPDQMAKVDLMKSRGVFTDQSGDLLAALADHGVSLPAGMRSKEQQIATVNGLLRKYPNLTPDEIATNIGNGQINFGSDKKAATVAAGQEGKVSTAVNELSTFGDQALAASSKVPRGSFVPVNQLLQMADTSISDPNLLTLKLKLNALNNAYNVLSARGGTDAASRAHVQQLFSAATNDAGVQALVKGLKEEGAGAKAAAGQASHVGNAATPAASGARPPLSAYETQ